MLRRLLAVSVASVLCLSTAGAVAQTVLKLVTQTPASVTDARKDYPGIVADATAAANTGLTLKVYFEGQLVTANEMWRALVDGTIDLGIIFLPTGTRDVPEIGLMAMPSVLTKQDDIKKLNASPAMTQFAAALEKRGVLYLGGYWDTLTIASTGDCVRQPVDLMGVAARGPGRPFEVVLESAGAIPVPFTAADIPRALKTGAVDLIITTSPSLMVGDGPKALRCVSDSTAAVPGMVQTSLVANKAAFEKLTPDQQAALRAAAAKGIAHMQAEVAKGAAQAMDRLRGMGVNVFKLDEADIAQWRERSQALALRDFAASSPDAAAILKSALLSLGRAD